MDRQTDSAMTLAKLICRLGELIVLADHPDVLNATYNQGYTIYVVALLLLIFILFFFLAIQACQSSPKTDPLRFNSNSKIIAASRAAPRNEN